MFDVFREPAVNNDIPGYNQTVTNLMDCALLSKIEQDMYRERSNGATKLYNNYVLVFDNCHLMTENENFSMRQYPP